MKEIEVYFNELKAGERLQDVRMFTEAANMVVIPFLKENGIEVYMDNIEAMLFSPKILIERYLNTLTNDKKFYKLSSFLRDRLVQARVENFKHSLYGRKIKELTCANRAKNMLQFTRLDDQSGLLVPDEEAIRKEYTVTIKEPEDVAVYNRYMAAIDALNAFFVGKAPLAWNVYFACENGKFKPNKDVNINWEYYKV